MAYYQPSMSYSVKLNGASVPSGEGKVSFQTNYNQIAITRICSNQSTNNFQVWITKTSATEWGLGIGIKGCEDVGSLAGNTEKTVTMIANSSIFTEGDGEYRLALCTRGDIDNTWDVTEVLIVVSGLVFKPNDADAVELIVNR